MAELTHFLPLLGDPSDLRTRLREEPGLWLPASSRRGGPTVWHVPLQGLGFVRTVECSVGPSTDTGEGTWRSIVWTPTSEPGDVLPMERLLPDLHGEIGVVADNGRASLVLTGQYDAPAGPVGRVADAVVLHRVARSTAETFLRAVADQLTADPVTAGAAAEHGSA